MTEEWVCIDCGVTLNTDINWAKGNVTAHKYVCRACCNKRKMAWWKDNKQTEYGYAKKWRDKVKIKAFDMLGGKCARCGFDDPRALQVDHINGMTEQYKTSTFRSGTHLYQVIVRGDAPLSDFQLLCANCNWIKKFENHEHRGTNGRYV